MQAIVAAGVVWRVLHAAPEGIETAACPDGLAVGATFDGEAFTPPAPLSPASPPAVVAAQLVACRALRGDMAAELLAQLGLDAPTIAAILAD